MKIWTVDAFTSQPYTGNPAAVMIVPDFPEDGTCQKIAAEMNLSETAFIKPLREGVFHIRWFTPTVEIELCGHATLASAHIIFQEGLTPTSTVTFTSLSGFLPVTKGEDSLTLDFPLQPTGADLSVEVFIDQLHIKEPVVKAVQAGEDVILEFANSHDVRQLLLDPKDILKMDYRGLIVTAYTAPGDGPYDFVSRFFAPSKGVNEDPVTGSAHCKLADYWRKKLNKRTFFAYQASKRGGEIHVMIQRDRVLLTGKAITVMEGTWRA